MTLSFFIKFEPKINIFKKTHYILFIFFIIGLSSCINISTKDQKKDSYFEFAKKDFNDVKVYNLSGEWDFYWDTLLTPKQIKNTNLKPIKVDVPLKWSKYKIDGKKLPVKGYATYQTKIIAPKGRFYSLKFKRIFLSCNIFIDDSLSLKIGKVGKDKDNFKANRLTKEFVFFAKSDTTELTIQVANFKHKKSGIMRPVKFGTPKAIIQFSYTNLLYDVLIIGALAFMMIFYFIFYFYKKENKSNLFFSIFLLIEIITISLDRELILIRIFPGLNWSVASKLYYISTFLRALMFVILIESFTKKLFSKTIKKLSIYFTIVISVFIIFTPMRVYSETLILMILFSALTLFYEIIVTWKAAKIDKTMFLSFHTLIIILLAAINDSLYDYGVINTFYATGLGIFLFTLSQAVLISIQNASIFNKEESLSSRALIEKNLKQALLTTPSYDLPAAVKKVVEKIGVEKIILFTVDNERYIFYLIAEKHKKPELIDKPVDFNKNNKHFNTQKLKKAIDTHSNIVLTDKNFDIKSKNIIILPIVKDNRIITVLYFENKIDYLTKEQISVIESLKFQFNSMINTALTYFLLEKMNTLLEEKVKERTAEVEKQNEQLDEKNQQLDEKIQLLEEQYAVQNEINSEMQSQVEELEVQNKNLEIQNKQINEQKEIITKQNRQIKTNIEYAKIIQGILNINEKTENQPFKDFFHLDLPKDIVSGDFYFSQKIDDLFIFALADCTGHGVPGALMGTFSSKNLEKIINNEYKKHKSINPAIVLDKLREKIKSGLHTRLELKDGLDIALCVYDIKKLKLDFAGAYNSLYLIRNNNLKVFKADRMPIGSYIEGFEFPFKTKTINLIDNDIIYIHTDGYVDQFGSKTNEKFYTTNLKKLLIDIHQLPLNKQKSKLYENYINWKGVNMQIDDVSIIGAKI